MGLSLHFLSALQLVSIVSSVTAVPSGPLLPHSTTFGAVKEQTYDYVIVGGGLTGLVVANRLSEDPSKSVLVIENGPIDTGPAVTIPYYATILNTADMYDLTSAPVLNIDNVTVKVTVGKVVGGGTMVNGMAWNRGSNADYDAWEALGNPGWGWAGLGSYFKKSTHYTAPSESTVKEYNITFNPDAYGNGPVQLSIPSFQYQDLKTIYGAWYSENVTFPRDGIETGLGVFWQSNDIDNKTATRSNAHVTYYVPVQGRPNLALLTGTKVTQILTDNVKGNLCATGVHILSANSTVSKVYAAKEVILAAGGVFTPHILMLSGIGPKDVLTAANITVKRELPGVGSNFQDHTPLVMIFNLSNLAFPNPTTIPNNATFNALAAAQYAKDRSGPWSYGRGYAQAQLRFKEVSAKYAKITSLLTSQEPTQYLPERYAKNAALLKGFKKQKEILIDRYLGDKAAITQFPIGAYGRSTVTLQKPLSRGTIELNITNPEALPVVQFNTLMNPVDKAVLAELVRFNRVHWSLPALSGYNPIEIQPGPQYQTDDEIVSASVKTGALTPTFAHMSGSCAMMPEELGGCVNDKLMVYGVAGLSIVDASLLPMIPACNLQATMYAVAEKAADIIKNR